MSTLTTLLGIPHRFISAYNPHADGKVERSVRTVKTTIMKLLHGATVYWHLHLPFVQYAYNDKIQSLTGSTPFALMFGRMANAARDYTTDPVTDLPINIESWQKHQNDIVSLIYPAIADRAGKHQAAYRSQLDKNRRKLIYDSLIPGTVVMIKDPKFLLAPRPSAEPAWIGPYTIVRRTSHGPYIVKDELGVDVNRTIPVDHMFVLYTPNHIPSDADSVDDPDNVYVASRIINHREDDIGQLEYLVVYKGYAKPYWTRGHNINDPSLVAKYFKASSLSKSLPSHTTTSIPSDDDSIDDESHSKDVMKIEIPSSKLEDTSSSSSHNSLTNRIPTSMRQSSRTRKAVIRHVQVIIPSSPHTLYDREFNAVNLN